MIEATARMSAFAQTASLQQGQEQTKSKRCIVTDETREDIVSVLSFIYYIQRPMLRGPSRFPYSGYQVAVVKKTVPGITNPSLSSCLSRECSLRKEEKRCPSIMISKARLALPPIIIHITPSGKDLELDRGKTLRAGARRQYRHQQRRECQ